MTQRSSAGKPFDSFRMMFGNFAERGLLDLTPTKIGHRRTSQLHRCYDLGGGGGELKTTLSLILFGADASYLLHVIT